MPLRLLSWGIVVIRFPAWCSYTVRQLGDSIGGDGGRVWATQQLGGMIWHLQYVLNSLLWATEKSGEGGSEEEKVVGRCARDCREPLANGGLDI